MGEPQVEDQEALLHVRLELVVSAVVVTVDGLVVAGEVPTEACLPESWGDMGQMEQSLFIIKTD